MHSSSSPLSRPPLLEVYQKDVKDYWQAADFLPDFSRDSWIEDVKEIKSESSELSDSLIAVLVGDMITEEAQDYICKLPARYKKLAGRYKVKQQNVNIPWITSRQ